MKHRLVVALAIPTVAAIFVWGGCALVIDLGDEAKLLPAEASVDSATVDAGADVAVVPVNVCGLAPPVNLSCATCFESRCCDTGKACANDPVCVDGLACVQDCLAQVNCIIACLSVSNDALTAMVNCSSSECPVCTPPPDCVKLGECAFPLSDAGAEGLLRRVARGTILELDPVKCDKQRTDVGKVSDASACR